MTTLMNKLAPFDITLADYTADCCSRCGGNEVVMNPDYLVWEAACDYRLPAELANDSRRHGSPAAQREWDAEAGAPPRYLPCPVCHSLAEMPEAARKAWREGVAPQLSTPALLALRDGLLRNDNRLIQGSNSLPAPLQGNVCRLLQGACAVCFAGWMGESRDTVGAADSYFAKVCRNAEEALGYREGVAYFLEWYDSAPRDQMRAALISEINIALAKRGQSR